MLPEAFLTRLRAQLGEEYDAFLESLERPRAVALRLNPLKCDRLDLPFLGQNVPWEPMGRYYDPESRPGLHPYHEAGVYYLQEASAMCAAALLDPQPGERILDLCAAPGGKSTQIAGRMQGKGFLLCSEYVFKRAKILSQNIERLGIGNATVINCDPDLLSPQLPEFFDRILVDAPCSGEGMFRKEAAAVTDWSQETVEMCARRQGGILEEAAKMLRPGGRLVYSTCTFAPEENEDAIRRFLEKHPDFTPEAVDAPWFTPVGPGMFRLWPHKLLGEGHFVAVLRKSGRAEPRGISQSAGEKLPKQWLSFADELGISLPPGRLETQLTGTGTRLWWLAEEAPEDLRASFIRKGLELGEVKKDRFEPAHALAMWMKACKSTLCLKADSPEIKRYLHGETLPCDRKGWTLVQVDGYSIGWGKGDGHQLKNHYPKGLRR